MNFIRRFGRVLPRLLVVINRLVGFGLVSVSFFVSLREFILCLGQLLVNVFLLLVVNCDSITEFVDER